MAVNGEGCIRGIYGDDVPFAEVARAAIERSFVAPEESALETAVGAECWRRYANLFVE